MCVSMFETSEKAWRVYSRSLHACLLFLSVKPFLSLSQFTEACDHLFLIISHVYVYMNYISIISLKQKLEL